MSHVTEAVMLAAIAAHVADEVANPPRPSFVVEPLPCPHGEVYDRCVECQD